MGYNPLDAEQPQYTVPTTILELKPGTARTRVQTAIDLNILRTQEPTQASKTKVKDQSTWLGDIQKLSQADLDLLALCLDLKTAGQTPTLITDDYTIQNVARHLSIPYQALTTHGIRYKFKWSLQCPACKRTYNANYEEKCCGICGTPLKRRVVKKTALFQQPNQFSSQQESEQNQRF
ncbi:MAG: ribonuclease VapC [Candidatus Bathyarchaeia archaeon]